MGCSTLLSNALSKIRPKKGPVAASGFISPDGSPTITTTDDGVTFPVFTTMDDATLDRLTGLAKPAPFGKGKETIIDTSVRDCLRICADALVLSEDTNKVIDRVASQAAKQLGVEQGLTPHLHNLLVYKPGGMFKPHKDTEKVPNQVASLVVVLNGTPTDAGGNLVVSGPGSAPLTYPPVSNSWVAFFSDQTHEVTKVKAGTRVALVFNLATKPGDGEVKHDDEDADLKREIAEWEKDIDYRLSHNLPLYKAMRYLDHEYTKGGLSVSGLKGDDRLLVESLQKTGGLDIYIMHLRWEQVTSCETKEEEEDFCLSNTVCCSDIPKMCQVQEYGYFDDSYRQFASSKSKPQLLCPHDFDDYPSVDFELEQEMGVYFGNEGEDEVSAYEKAVIVVWPSSRRLHFCPIDMLIHMLARVTKYPGCCEHTARQIEAAINRLVTPIEPLVYSSELLRSGCIMLDALVSKFSGCSMSPAQAATMKKATELLSKIPKDKRGRIPPFEEKSIKSQTPEFKAGIGLIRGAFDKEFARMVIGFNSSILALCEKNGLTELRSKLKWKLGCRY